MAKFRFLVHCNCIAEKNEVTQAMLSGIKSTVNNFHHLIIEKNLILSLPSILPDLFKKLS